jgi:hypothetical protein
MKWVLNDSYSVSHKMLTDQNIDNFVYRAKNSLLVDGKSLYNVRMSLEDMRLISRIRQGEYVIADVF